MEGTDFEEELDPRLWTLSPSDFGFHNALWRTDGTIAFLDFEYFGWDDPAKLACDFLLHPGMNLGEAECGYFMERLPRVFPGDTELVRRVELSYPLYGLRWCMILLNEFLPERWARRAYAGAHADRERAQLRQLDKARAMLRKVLPRG